MAFLKSSLLLSLSPLASGAVVPVSYIPTITPTPAPNPDHREA